MFNRDCLLDVFKEQLRNKDGHKLSQLKGGKCPVCDTWVELTDLIELKKNETGKTISTFLSPNKITGKENSPNTEVTERNASVRETLQLALKGASSSKLEAIMRELDSVWSLDPGSKVLIFSQYL